MLEQNGGRFSPEILSPESISFSKDTQIIVVTPVYREYENGNAFKLLDTFSRQNADRSTFGLLLVVNNTQDERLQASNGYRENQELLNLRTVLNGDDPIPVDLVGYRREVIERVRASGLQVAMIDLSSSGEPDRNIGRVRDIGLQQAIAWFEQGGLGDNGIVANMDADTRVEKGYISGIVREFSNQDLGALFISLDNHVSEGSEALFASTFRDRYNESFSRWIQAVRSDVVEAGSPRIVARVSAYKEIGGIAHIDSEEDIDLSVNLSLHTHFHHANEMRVYPADRARPEGYDAQLRLDRLTSPEFSANSDEFRLSPRVFMLQMDLIREIREDKTIIKDKDLMQEVFDRYGVPYDHLQFKQALKASIGVNTSLRTKMFGAFDIYLEAIKYERQVDSNTYVDQLVDIFKAQLDDEETLVFEKFVADSVKRARLRLAHTRYSVDKAVRAMYTEGNFDTIYARSTSKAREFFDRNPWLSSRLQSIVATYPDALTAMRALTETYPEHLAKFEDSRLRRSVAILHGVTLFVQEARNNPDQFPDTIEILDRVGSS